MPTSRYDLEILIRTRKEGQGIEQANKQIDSFGKGYAGMLTKLTAGAAIIAGAGALVKEAFDLGKAGAGLMLAEQQFDNLAGSIGEDANDILSSLEEATGGMMSNAEMIASASQIISLGLGDTKEEVVDLGTLVSSLGWDMQQVILTFANNSKARLDALGLSVEDVNGRIDKFVQAGYSVDEAFDMAVIEAGKEKLELLGSAVETPVGAYQRLEVNVKNATDALKEHLAMGLLPVVEYLNGDYAEAMLNADKAAVDAAVTTDDFTQAKLASVDADNAIIKAAAQSSDSVEEFAQKLRDAGVHMIDDSTTAAWYEQEKAIQAVEEAFSQEYDASREAMTQQQQLIAERNAVMAEFVPIVGASTDALADHTSHVEELLAEQARLVEYRESFATLSGYIEASQGPVMGLVEAQQLLAESQGEWIQTTRNNSAEVASISEQLALDLTDDQENAYRDILNTVDEGSAEWLNAYSSLQNDLTESQRQALVAQSADLQAASGEVISVYTGNAAEAKEAQELINQYNAQISESYRQMAADIVMASISQTYGDNALAAQEAALQTQVALGLITQSQADEQLRVAQNMDQVRLASEALTQQYLADGELTAAESAKIATAVSLIEQGFDGSTTALVNLVNAGVTSMDELQGMTGDATDEVINLKDELTETGNMVVSPTVQVDTSDAQRALDALREAMDALRDSGGGGDRGGGGRASGGPVLPGERYRVGEGNRPEFLATPTGLFMIPGDRGRVFSNEQSQAMMGGGGVVGSTNETYHFHVQNSSQAHMMAELVRDKKRNQRRLAAYRSE